MRLDWIFIKEHKIYLQEGKQVSWFSPTSWNYNIEQVSVNQGPTSSLTEEASLWGLISKASWARSFKLMVRAWIIWAQALIITRNILLILCNGSENASRNNIIYKLIQVYSLLFIYKSRDYSINFGFKKDVNFGKKGKRRSLK